MSLKGVFPIEKWDFNRQSIFEGLSTAEVALLFENSKEKKYKSGEQIFDENGAAAGIFYIKEGTVKKYKVDNFNKEQIIYVATAGELMGYHAVLASEKYPDSAATLEECIIVFIPRSDFVQMLERSTALWKNLLRTLSHEFTVLVNNISVFAGRPARERMAITLLILREKFKKQTTDEEQIFINVSREDIASMAGTSREGTVRILRHFKNEQIIQTKGRKIWVTDVKKLADATNYNKT